MAGFDKPLAWLHGDIKTPPLSTEARVQTGLRCHELRIQDGDPTWRVIYRVDPDAVIICDVFAKKTQATPRSVIESCRRRLTAYDAIASGRR